MPEFISNSPEQTAEIGRKAAEYLKPDSCLLLYGEMGAGKTHFTKGIAEYFGAGDVVTSPTFALVNEYEGDIPIYHFDLFRLNGEEDLYSIGFFDYIGTGGIMVIEWSEKVPQLPDMLDNVSTARIIKTGDGTRVIKLDIVEERQC